MRWRVVQASVRPCRSTYSSSLTSFCCVNICFGCIDPGGWCWRTLSWDPSFPSPQFARKFEMPTSGKGRRSMIIKTYLDSACEFDRHADPARSGTAGKMQCLPSRSVPDHPFLRPPAPFALSGLRSIFSFPEFKNMQQIKRESEVGFLPEEKIFIGNRQFRSKRQATETPLCGGFGPRGGLKMSTRAGSRLARPQIFISRLACPCRSSGLRNSVHGIGLLLLR